MTKIHTEATTTALVVERPDALRAAGSAHAVIAAHQRDHDGEQKRLQQALGEIVVFESAPGRAPILIGGDIEQRIGDEVSADQAQEVRDDGEQRQHHGHGDQARRHQFLNGIGAQGAHGVDLLGDAHGAQFAGDAAGVASRDQQRREHRTQFAHQCDGDDLPDLPLRPVGGERARHLQRHHHAAEKADQADDEQRADADGVHLQEDVVGVMRRAENIAERAAAQEQKLLECLDRPLQEIEQSGSPGAMDAGMVDVNMKAQNEGPHRHLRDPRGPCI